MTTWVRRLLDPIGGDIVDHPHRKLRLNLRRVELVAVFEICTVLYEGAFSFHRDVPVPGLLALCMVYGAVSLVFLLAARYGQRHDTATLRHLPDVFLVCVLLLVQTGGYLFAESGRLVTGYAFTYLVCAALFLLPPRRFALIGLATLAFYASWVLALPFSVSDKIGNLANTSLIVGVAMLARWGLHRLEVTNERQRQEIAAQNERLADANRKLEARNVELGSLMAIAAHDLRSPLHGLNNLLELANAQPAVSEAAWRELMQEAGSSVASMLALIGRILEAHEAETQNPGNRTRRDLRGAIEAAVRRARATAERTGIALHLEVGNAPVRAEVDPDALDQILDNLLSNALRFSPGGSAVRIVVGTRRGAFIEISDEGMGVPLEEREQLFGKFRRGAKAPLNGPRGSGLGLFIVATLAAANDAKAFYRPGDGGGSVFAVEFRDKSPT